MNAQKPFGRDAARIDRHVDERSAGDNPVVARISRARIRRVGVRAEVRYAAAYRGLRAVALMVVEVDDEHATAGLLRVRARRDRRVVEDAEPHPARRFGVMSGRPHERERSAPSVDRGFERDQRRAGAARGGLVRAAVDDRVTVAAEIRRLVVLECVTGAPNELDIGRRMDARQFVRAGDPRVDPLAEHTAPGEFLRDDAHPVGTFDVRDARQMPGQPFVVRDEHGAKTRPS